MKPLDSDWTADRVAMLAYLETELIGPRGGARESLPTERPHLSYATGVLFPRGLCPEDLGDTLGSEEEDGADPSPVGDDRVDDPVALSGQWMPSSMGVSLYFTGASEIIVEVWGAGYEKPEAGEGWVRTPIAERDDPERVTMGPPPPGTKATSSKALGGRAEVGVLWRPLGDGWLVTVTLVNLKERPEDDRSPDDGDCLYQVGLRCRVPGGTILEYPSMDRVLGSDEDQELDLLYRRASKYAVGHGCSARWEGTPPTSVETSLIPRTVVPDVTHELADDDGDLSRVLSIAYLADEGVATADLSDRLSAFLDQYDRWITSLVDENSDVPDRLGAARDRILARLRSALDRMRGGVALLSSDPTVLRAFRLANLAMLMQMHHGRMTAGRSHRRNAAEVVPPSYDYLGDTEPRWRPFQLAFQLLTIRGLASPGTAEGASERDLVDLIWFPTGGGKTEAYLAVAAFEILRRRLVNRDAGAGTAVITRYTLRLLTSQQFQRSARLICALELIRRGNPVEFGDAPVSIGFWAGGGTSPNSFKDASERLDELLNSNRGHPFQLEACPWCGTEMAPRYKSEDGESYGFRADETSFGMNCPTDSCAFHTHLPVQVVDEGLYGSPPTFLIGTVDKFTRMAWVPEAGALFGTPGTLPPTLVIQDELHLLSGPLGTTAAVYEAAFQALMSHDGRRPKVVASTATIRSATDQVASLFDREVSLFPPAGLDADDSYFARVDRSTPGRLYAGVMSGHHRPSTSLIRVSSALLQAPEDVDLSQALDNVYRTLVVYHLSLRDLGKTQSYAYDDIPARLKAMDLPDGPREVRSVKQLTSNTPSYEIPTILADLERPPGDDRFVDFLVCTNMISVGVDINRLGLMVMHGQPKTTSEYIQASSRVGRKFPGLVVTHYSSNKPRDRSHYEDFQSYHEALYRHVEPTSVTPYSAPSRDRALHAALVVLIRHGEDGLRENRDAGRFEKDHARVRRAVGTLLGAVERTDPDELDSARAHLQRLVSEWDELARQRGASLRYWTRSNEPQFTSLIKAFGRDGDGWPTLNSMRNVDGESPIRIEGARYSNTRPY